MYGCDTAMHDIWALGFQLELLYAPKGLAWRVLIGAHKSASHGTWIPFIAV